MLMSVVFPEPEGPMSATHSPLFTAKLTPLRARSAPYCLTRLSMTTCCTVVRGCTEMGATTLTLHLGTRMPGGCSPAAAAEKRSGSPPASSDPQLKDTQSAAAAPPLQKPLCPNRWTAQGLPPHRSNRPLNPVAPLQPARHPPRAATYGRSQPPRRTRHRHAHGHTQATQAR